MRTTLLLLVLLVLPVYFAHAADISPELAISIAAEKTAYLLGDTITLHIKIKNISGQKYYFHKHGFRLEVKDNKGRRLHSILAGYIDHWFNPLDSFKLLELQQEFIEKKNYKIVSGEREDKNTLKKIGGVFIDESPNGEGPYCIVLKKDGIHRLRLRYSNSSDKYYDGDYSKGIKQENYKKLNAWKGKAYSNFIDVEIRGIQ